VVKDEEDGAQGVADLLARHRLEPLRKHERVSNRECDMQTSRFVSGRDESEAWPVNAATLRISRRAAAAARRCSTAGWCFVLVRGSLGRTTPDTAAEPLRDADR